MERVRIAKMADVSVGTVDRVIHGRSGVSEASRKRVEEILEKLDYQPNMYASALASNKKYAFACLLPQHENRRILDRSGNGHTQSLQLTLTSTSPCTCRTMTRMTIVHSRKPRRDSGTGAGRSDVCPHRPAIHQALHR